MHCPCSVYLDEQQEQQAGMQQTQHFMQVNRMLKVGEGRPVDAKPIQRLRRLHHAGNVQPHAAEAEDSAEHLQPVTGAREELAPLLADGDEGLDQQVQCRKQQQHLQDRQEVHSPTSCHIGPNTTTFHHGVMSALTPQPFIMSPLTPQPFIMSALKPQPFIMGSCQL